MDTTEEPTETALFLGGGAPNFTLMSGAVLALHRSGIKFHIVSMAGAGAVVGLMYLVPKGLTPEEAMENTVNFGISDELYQFFPVNFKAFTKWGPSADAFNDYWSSLPMVQDAAHQHGKSHFEKLQGDLLLFFGTMLCPTDLTPGSLGLSGHPPFIDHLIDFDRLPTIPENIEINAFRLRDRKIVDFRKDEITADHLHAALSFPMIYPPHRIGNELYYEGAAFQCINPSLVPPEKIKHFIVLQPMKTCQIMPPRDLWNSYSMSVMMPVTALALYGVDAIEELAGLDDKDKLEVIEKAVHNLESGKLKNFLNRYRNIGDSINAALREAISETIGETIDEATGKQISSKIVEKLSDKISDKIGGTISDKISENIRERTKGRATDADMLREHLFRQALELVDKAVDAVRTMKFDAARRQPVSELRPLPSLPKLIRDRWFEAEFDIAQEHLPYVFDWTRSNLEYLFEVGYEAGIDLAVKIKKSDLAAAAKSKKDQINA